MPAYYTYFISTLPMLIWGARPPFSFEKFLNLCQGFIPEAGIELLKKCSVTGEYVHPAPARRGGVHPVAQNSTLKKWHVFDTALRNELVRIRASHKHIDPQPYIRQQGHYRDSYLTHSAMNAHRNPSTLEAEKALDQERWNFLDELSRGHYFDIDFLIVYVHKLLLLERWERIVTADKSRLTEQLLQSI